MLKNQNLFFSGNYTKDVVRGKNYNAIFLDTYNLAINHVINFDTPQTYDDYIHRIGRTGRGGKSGSAFTFIPARDQRVVLNNNPRRSFKKPARMEGRNTGKNHHSARNAK